MTEDGLYGSNLASGLNTNTDVKWSSFKKQHCQYQWLGYRLL